MFFHHTNQLPPIPNNVFFLNNVSSVEYFSWVSFLV